MIRELDHEHCKATQKSHQIAVHKTPYVVLNNCTSLCS